MIASRRPFFLYFLFAIAILGCIFLVAPRPRVKQAEHPKTEPITASPTSAEPTTFVRPTLRSEAEVLQFLDSLGRLPLQTSSPGEQLPPKVDEDHAINRCHKNITGDQYRELQSKNGDCKISISLASALDPSIPQMFTAEDKPIPDSVKAKILLIDSVMNRRIVGIQNYSETYTVAFLEKRLLLEYDVCRDNFSKVELRFWPISPRQQLLCYSHEKWGPTDRHGQTETHYFTWRLSGLRHALTRIDEAWTMTQLRSQTFSSKLIQANPLLIQVNYEQELSIPAYDEVCESPIFIQDSAVIPYFFDPLQASYNPDWTHSKLSSWQYLTYAMLEEEDHITIQANYKNLRKTLLGKDSCERRGAQHYLSEVMDDILPKKDQDL